MHRIVDRNHSVANGVLGTIDCHMHTDLTVSRSCDDWYLCAISEVNQNLISCRRNEGVWQAWKVSCLVVWELLMNLNYKQSQRVATAGHGYYFYTFASRLYGNSRYTWQCTSQVTYVLIKMEKAGIQILKAKVRCRYVWLLFRQPLYTGPLDSISIVAKSNTYDS